MLNLIKKLFNNDIHIETTGVYKEYIYSKEDKEYAITVQEIKSRGQKELDLLEAEEIMYQKYFKKKRFEVENRIANDIMKERDDICML